MLAGAGVRIVIHFESPSEQSSTQADKQLPAATFRYKEACAATADRKVATAGARKQRSHRRALYPGVICQY